MFPERFARARIAQARDEIRYSLKMIANGNPLGAETDQVRQMDRLQSKENLTPTQARIISESILRQAEAIKRESSDSGEFAERTEPAQVLPVPGPELVRGDTIDFVDVAFLARGSRIARSVGRVSSGSTGRGRGSGVLIGAELFLTNNHVIEARGQAASYIVEFDYERDEDGVRRRETRFRIDPSIFIFDTVDGLDFTIFSVGDRLRGDTELGAFGVSPLSDAPDKHMIGEFANIVQHPQGRLKEVVLRENRLVSRFDDFLHYIADTDQGSSGSPVYNSEWKMIALHHWGGPFGAMADPRVPGSSKINEGIRISSIVRHLRRNMDSYEPAVQARLQLALSASMESLPSGNLVPQRGAVGESGAISSVRLEQDGSATWTVPVEISIRLPMAGGPPAEAPQPEPPLPVVAESSPATVYADRKGYLPHFLPGLEIPLPRLGPTIVDDAAPLLSPEPGENPFELKYHHFSVIMNRRRRLAFVTSCMIDGASSKSIGRTSRVMTDLDADDRGLAETTLSLDGAEADSWIADPRIDRAHQSGKELYRNQVVPGFPDPRSAGRLARMFQKGHLVRRLDPAWGQEARALAAEMDTFHWTNAAPQVGFFNQGTADGNTPGTGGGNLWRAAENYVLRNAVAEDQRVVSFTGPIFAEGDRGFRFTHVPSRFFKIAVWVEAGLPRSLALIVDQGQVIEVWPEALGSDPLSGSEAFQDADELDRVADFLSTVEAVERLTDLDFGDVVRAADVRRRQKEARLDSTEDALLVNAIHGDGLAGAPPSPNDLTQIVGIGPTLARALNAQGIHSSGQIATWKPSEAQHICIMIGYPNRAERDDWIGQAKKIAGGTGKR